MAERSRKVTITAFALMGALVIGASIFAASSKRADRPASRERAAQLRLAKDAETRYELAKRSGTPAERCAEAHKVAELYQRASDDAHYALWRQTEATDCATPQGAH